MNLISISITAFDTEFIVVFPPTFGFFPLTIFELNWCVTARTTKMSLDSKVRAKITIMLKIKKISKSFLSHIGNIK